MFLSDRPGFLLLILDPNCSSPNILPYYQSNMTATSPGIGTQSVYPSNQFTLFLFNCFSNFSDDSPKEKKTVSKGARKVSVFLCVFVPFSLFLFCPYLRPTSTILSISLVALETCRIPKLSVRNSS